MNLYKVIFHGRKGSGIDYSMGSTQTAMVVAEDAEDVRLALYDEYSHIGRVQADLELTGVNITRGIFHEVI